MRAIIDKAILSSRWILAVFFLGLVVALAAYAVRFLYKLWTFATGVLRAEDTRLLIDLLHLLDSALVASLVVTVAIASYDSLVSRLGRHDESGETSWVTNVDPGNLKIKLSVALIAISSIHLLQIFMEVSNYGDREVVWGLAIHAMFLTGALVLVAVDRVSAAGKRSGKG
ncbi:YqhA family protein [Roseomonas sp. AR75]|uniref:YqhA family protein n=1 Tax=Roseomonas sp. AR75 TaxID=2562311 RepID=UPI0010C00B1C|nr:YqhA family protein [Roseomonas sp. AR75]